MNVIALLALLSAVVSGVFAALVLKQFVQRRKPFQLFWGLGLLFFAIAAAAEFFSFTYGWSPVSAKTYYIFGAMLLVGFLGLGTTYITFGEKAGRAATVFVVGLGLLASGMVLTAQVDMARFEGAIVSGDWSGVMPVFARVVTILLNILGSLVLVGGAVFSGVQVWRKRHDMQRLVANSVIAAGALLIAVAGTLGALLGLGQEIHTIAQAPGISVMFAGFLLAGRASKSPPNPATAHSGARAAS